MQKECSDIWRFAWRKHEQGGIYKSVVLLLYGFLKIVRNTWYFILLFLSPRFICIVIILFFLFYQLGGNLHRNTLCIWFYANLPEYNCIFKKGLIDSYLPQKVPQKARLGKTEDAAESFNTKIQVSVSQILKNNFWQHNRWAVAVFISLSLEQQIPFLRFSLAKKMHLYCPVANLYLLHLNPILPWKSSGQLMWVS